jgi:hypothetical protein
LADTDTLNAISNLSRGYYVLAEAYHNYHVGGFADWRGTLKMRDKGQANLAIDILAQVEDEDVTSLFGSLGANLRNMEELDRQILEWLAQYSGLDSFQGRRKSDELERRLNDVIRSGPEGHPQGPIWVMSPEYQALVEKSSKILAALAEALAKVEQRVRSLLDAGT